jgi:hypothetical protein
MPPRDAIHPWEAHLSGLRAIIQARRNENVACLTDSDELTAIVDDTRSNSETRSAVDELYHGLGESTSYADLQAAGAALHSLVATVRPIFAPASYLLDNPDRNTRKDVECLQTTLLSHLSSLKRWPARLSDDCRPKALQYAQSGAQDLPLGIYPGRVDTYPNCQRSSIYDMNFG